MHEQKLGFEDLITGLHSLVESIFFVWDEKLSLSFESMYNKLSHS